MLDMFEKTNDEITVIPGRRLSAKVEGVFTAVHDRFQTAKTDWLELTFDGIVGDYHVGLTRRSGGREPWYPRGTEIRNERQLSIVAADELTLVAKKMGIAEVRPEWIGANLVLDIPRLSMLPAGTMLFFKGGVTLKVDGQNIPCRLAGRSIAEHARMEDVNAGSLLFPKVARRLRGLVAWVEKPGRIEMGEELTVRVPEQWIYE